MCVVASIAGVLAVGVYALVAGRRKKTSDDPELGSAVTTTNDNTRPSDQSANTEPSSRASGDLQRRTPSTGILVPDTDTPMSRSSRSRRSRISFIPTSLESIPEHEQWQFCFCSDSGDNDDTSPPPGSFHSWYLDYRCRILLRKISIMAGHTGNHGEARPSASLPHEEDTTTLHDFVNVSRRRVHSALKRRRGPIRHHDTGPIASANINEQSTHLDQVPPSILRRGDRAEPSVAEQPADKSKSATAIKRTA